MLPRAPASGPLLLTTVALSALINALSVRTGDTVLFRLPGWLPLLGGPVTFEALVYGGLSGAALAGIVLAFLVAQRHIPTADLVRLIPRAFAPVALVVTVALTFAPSTIRHAQQIREAQLVRGNPFRRLRDWLPLLVPLLVGGLERAFALAEALTARGFAAPAVPDWRPRALLLTGVAVLLLGFGLLAFDQPGGWPLLTGGALAGVGVWLAGRDVPRTRYRQRAWRASDTAVVLTALTALAAYTPLPGLAHTVLLYYPYPALIWPEFDIIIGFMTLGLVWPALARWSAGTSPHKNGASHD